MLNRICRQALIGVWLVMAGSGMAAHAHHSAAGVDMTQTVTITGILKDFDFSAPHAQIVVVSTDTAGAPIETKVSTLAPAGLIKQGFKPRDFASGQKVEMAYHPNRNGLGGLLVTLKLQDGRIVKGDVY